MVIQVDSREHKSEWDRIRRQFDRAGAEYFRSKLWVGDYMSLDNPRLIIDRKKDLQELIGNVTQQHERFQAELVRAQKAGINLIILCEHGADITELTDVYFWHNPRLDMTRWITQDGKPRKIKKYPKATKGESLYKSLCTIRDKYGVRFEFCTKQETGQRIMELLEVRNEQ